MDFSIFYAKWLGFYLFIFAIAMIINAKDMKILIQESASSKSMILLTGAISLLFGLLIVLTHNIWNGAFLLVTLLGYLAILKGIVRICFTEFAGRTIRRFTEELHYRVAVGVCLVLGSILLYLGFMGR